MTFDVGLLAEIISAILIVLSALLGRKYRVFKKKLTRLRELLDELDEALKDERVTKEEMAAILEKGRVLVEDP